VNVQQLRQTAKAQYAQGKGRRDLKGYSRMGKAALLSKLGMHEEARAHKSQATRRKAIAFNATKEGGDSSVRKAQVKGRILRSIKRAMTAKEKSLGRTLTQQEKRAIAAKALAVEVKAIRSGTPEMKPKRGNAQNLKPAAKNSNRASFKPEDIDLDKAEAGYSHISHSPRTRGKSDQEHYVKFMEGLRADLETNLPKGQEKTLEVELDRAKKEYLSHYNRMINAASVTVSAHIAGGSKFNHRQASRRGSAYDRTIESFSRWQNGIQIDIESNTGIAKVKELARRESAQQAQIGKDRAKERAKERKAAQNKLPIVNHPGEGFRSMTAEEWKKTHNDYKGINVSTDGTHRYRVRMGAPVHITDMKQRTPDQARAGK